MIEVQTFSASTPIGPSLINPAAVAAWVDAHLHLSAIDREVFAVVAVDVRNRPISVDVVSVGTLDTSLVHPREVFRGLITLGASGCVLVHNHPSGDATPSREDVDVTKKLVAGGIILGIRVLDHVVIGREADGAMAWRSLVEIGGAGL